jgi:hypothetical protein
VVRVAGHSSLQIVRDLGQACAIVAKRETALPIRWAMWVALAARVFLSLRSLDRPLQQPRFNKAVKRGAWSPDGFAGVPDIVGQLSGEASIGSRIAFATKLAH